MLLRRSCTTTKIAFTTFVLTPFIFVACAQGSNRPDFGNGEGGEGGEDWGQQSSSSASSSSGMGGNGGSSSGSGSSSTSGSSSSTSSSSSGGGPGPTSFIVLRVGDGTVALSAAAAPAFIEYFETNGNPTPGKTTVALPQSASGSHWPLTLSGTATAEGNLSLAANGKYVFVAGYGAAPFTPTVNTTDAAIYPRVIGRLDALGSVDTTTSLGTAFTANSIRGATSTDGLAIWVAGNGTTTTGGVHHTTLGASTATQILATPTNARFVHIFANKLYGTSGAGTFVNVFAIGAALPMTPGQTATPLPGMATSGASPYSFALLDRLSNISGPDTLYVADDRLVASGGGIQRWVYDGSSWALEITIADGMYGVRGLTAAIEGSGVRIIATTAETPTNRILSIFDQPGFSPAIVPIAISPTNTLYRGVAFAPK